MKKNGQGRVFSTVFNNRFENLVPLLEAAGLPEALPGNQPILIKPNLVENLPPPITTPVALIAELVNYLQKRVANPIIIGEGTGSLDYDTFHPFRELGYSKLAREKKISLIDLNEEPCIGRKRHRCRRWPELYLPKIAFESYIISVPVLKVHTLAGVTLTMKNMMGFPPPSRYRHGNSWGKSSFHLSIQEAVADLNRYRTPDFTILDATVGMAEAHLWGRSCEPPVNILAVGCDPVAMDAYGAGLLSIDWRKIGHIAQVHGELGTAEPLEVVQV
jgi:uncharacterized protein (DUF362 family)